MIPLETLKLTFEGQKEFLQKLEEIAENRCGPAVDLSRPAINFLIECDSVTSLCDALAKNRTITTLSLYGQNIGSTTLLKRDFSRREYPLETFGAKDLAKILEKNRTITSLNLSRCHIGMEGIGHLFDAIKENTTLLSLDLSINPFIRHNDEPLIATRRKYGTPSTIDWLMFQMNFYLKRNRKMKKEGIGPENKAKIDEFNAEIAKRLTPNKWRFSEWIQKFTTVFIFDEPVVAKLTHQSSKAGLVDTVDSKSRVESILIPSHHQPKTPTVNKNPVDHNSITARKPLLYKLDTLKVLPAKPPEITVAHLGPRLSTQVLRPKTSVRNNLDAS